MNLGMTPSEYHALKESAKALPVLVQSLAPRSPVAPSPVATSPTLQLALKDVAVLSREALIQRYGPERAAKAIELANSQAPTPKQAFSEYQRAERAAKAKLGRDLRATGQQVQHHSEKEFTHVIVTQLDLLLDGAIPSVSTVLRAAFPDDSKKAKSIGNSQHGKRRKKAWKSPEVTNHPLEIAMQAMHGTDSMNRRHGARTFGQSLSINREMFEYYDTVTKLKAQVEEQGTRISTLEQKVACIKNREALADAGATSSRDKVLALYAQDKKQTEIAKLLDMPPNTVKSILRRSKNG